MPGGVPAGCFARSRLFGLIWKEVERLLLTGSPDYWIL